MTELFELHNECVKAVFENDYYVAIFKAIMSGKFHDVLDENDIIEFWNCFWFELLDNKSIHRHPFNMICDICESDLT